MDGQGIEPIMLSALQHYSYCPRQYALIHIEQAFAENVHTMRGNAVHERVDDPGFSENGGARTERALPLYCDRLGLVGKADIVEFLPDGTPYPVEYKHGPKRQKHHDDLQLAAQALCLEEMTGKAIHRGAIYHHSSRRRREVEITDTLRYQVEETVAAIRTLFASGKLPPPVNDARCKECSLKETCQPEAVAATSKIHDLRSGLFEPDEV
ncbi:MAG: CRISPR-associated protein Cas4 [Gammaproteobacteria bacterium]